jgi:autotransporter-associated beta strand protein
MKSVQGNGGASVSTQTNNQRTLARRARVLSLAAAGIFAAMGSSARAATNGVYSDLTTAGLWSNTANWTGGNVASGTDAIADFSTLNLTAANLVHLDQSFTVGNLLVGDTTATIFNYSFDNNAVGTNVLTMATSSGTPTVTLKSGTTTFSLGLAGNQGVVFASPYSTALGAVGNVTLNGTNTYTGTTTISGGTLTLDFANFGGAATASQILYHGVTAGSLTLNAGTLTESSTSNQTKGQSFGGVLISSGASNLTQVGRTSGAHPWISLGSLTRTAGATVEIDSQSASGGSLTDGTTGYFTTQADGASGILGGWATANGGSDWARATTSAGTAGTVGTGEFHIYGYGQSGAAYVNTAATTAASNLDMTASVTLNSNVTVGSVRFNNASTGATLNLNGTNIIATGGILVAPTASLNATTITGGTALTSGNGSDLIVNQYDTNGALTIVGNIANNGSSQAIGLTKTGPGTLVISGNDTFTGNIYLNTGSLQLGSATALNTSTTGTPVNALLFGSSSSTTGSFSLGGYNAAVASISTANANGYFPVIQNASSTAAAMTVNGSSTTSYTGTIQDGTGGGAFSLVKAGSGSLTLGGTLAYTGNTTVTGGTLAVSSTIASSKNFIVGTGATLDLSGVGSGVALGSLHTVSGLGTILGSISAASGSVIIPGTATLNATTPTQSTSTVGQLNIANLTLAGGSNTVFSFTNGPSTNSLVNVSGTLTLSSTANDTAVDIYAAGTTNPFTPSTLGTTFDLFQYGSLTGTPSSAFKVADPVGGLTYAFGSSGGFVTVTISGTLADDSTWGVDGNGSWDTTTPSQANWTNNVTPQAAGDTARFGDTSPTNPSKTVTLNSSLSVGQMYFTGTSQYTIVQGGSSVLTLDNGGSGAGITVTGNNPTISVPIALNDNLTTTISGGTTLNISGGISNSSASKMLTFAGAGTLALPNANTYGPSAGSVGTFVTGLGTLAVGNSNSLSTGDLSITANSTLQSTASISLANNVSLGSGVTSTIDTQGNTLTMTGAITDNGGAGSGTGGLVKIGSGTLVLNSIATNNYGGGTLLTNGIIQIWSSSSLGASTGNLTFNGGTLQLGQTIASTTRNYVINSGKTAVIDLQSNSLTDSGTINSVGTTNTSTADGLSIIGTGTLTLNGTNTFTGQTVINNAAGTLTLGSALALQNSTLNYNTGILSFGTLTAATFGGLAGNQGIALTNTATAAVALSVGGNNASTTYSGVLSGTGSLTKNGSGNLILSGTNTYSGSTGVNNAGTLTLTGVIGGGTSQGFVTVNPGATLTVNGGSLTASGLTINETAAVANVNVTGGGSINASGGTITVGGDNGASGAILTVTSGTVTANVLNIGRNGGSTSGLVSGDVGGGLVLNGTSAVVDVATTIGDGISVNANSNANIYVGAGTLNVGGLTTVTENNARSSVLEVTGTGVFNGSGGVQLGGIYQNPTAELLMKGGVANVSGITFGAAISNASAGAANILEALGGSLYIGSTGLVQGSTGANPVTPTINLGGAAVATAPTLAASASWSSSLGMTLTNSSSGAVATIQTADSSGAAQNITLSGVLGGTGGLIKTGAGTLFLNSSGNTYTGVTNISGGTLNINSEYALGGANYSGLIFNGGTLQYASTLLNAVTDVSTKPVTILAGGGTIDTNGNTISFANSIGNSGTGGLTKAGLGVLNVSGGTYTGPTNILAGTLSSIISNGLATGSAYNVSGGTLDASAFTNTIAGLTVTSGGTLDLGIGNLLTDTGTASLAGILNLSGTVGSLTSPIELLSYSSETGAFTPGTIPSGYTLSYNSNGKELDLVAISSGPATLTWNNAGGAGDGLTWDTNQANFNNGTGVVAFSNGTGGAGDNVTFSDTNNGNYNVSIPGTVTPSSTIVNNSSANYNFNGSGGIGGVGSLNKLGTSSLILYTSNTYTGGTNVSGGALVLASKSALPLGTNLNIGSGGLVIARNLGTAYALSVGSLTDSGKLNLNNNALVVHNTSSTSLATVRSLVIAGYNNGAWNGSSGIISLTADADTTHLTALGILVNDNAGTPYYGSGGTIASTFAGVSPADGDVLVKYTYYGDTNLDGKVDASDYSRIDSGFLLGKTGWANGDFNYDGVINGSDYTLIDNAFNTQGALIAADIAPNAVATAEIAPSGGSSAVPEPTTLGLLGIGAIGLLGRRSRRLRGGR